jgi:hypothetical protein
MVYNKWVPVACSTLASAHEMVLALVVFCLAFLSFFEIQIWRSKLFPYRRNTCDEVRPHHHDFDVMAVLEKQLDFCIPW